MDSEENFKEVYCNRPLKLNCTFDCLNTDLNHKMVLKYKESEFIFSTIPPDGLFQFISAIDEKGEYYWKLKAKYK